MTQSVLVDAVQLPVRNEELHVPPSGAAAPTIGRPVLLGEGGAGRSAFIGQRRVAMALPLCLELVDAVRCAERQRVAHLVDLLDGPAALVVLAAMVDENARPADLLAWTDDIVTKRQMQMLRGAPQPCGTHAAFNRHKQKGEQPDPACIEGERLYQRDRNRRRRAAV